MRLVLQPARPADRPRRQGAQPRPACEIGRGQLRRLDDRDVRRSRPAHRRGLLPHRADRRRVGGLGGLRRRERPDQQRQRRDEGLPDRDPRDADPAPRPSVRFPPGLGRRRQVARRERRHPRVRGRMRRGLRLALVGAVEDACLGPLRGSARDTARPRDQSRPARRASRAQGNPARPQARRRDPRLERRRRRLRRALGARPRARADRRARRAAQPGVRHSERYGIGGEVSPDGGRGGLRRWPRLRGSSGCARRPPRPGSMRTSQPRTSRSPTSRGSGRMQLERLFAVVVRTEGGGGVLVPKLDLGQVAGAPAAARARPPTTPPRTDFRSSPRCSAAPTGSASRRTTSSSPARAALSGRGLELLPAGAHHRRPARPARTRPRSRRCAVRARSIERSYAFAWNLLRPGHLGAGAERADRGLPARRGRLGLAFAGPVRRERRQPARRPDRNGSSPWATWSAPISRPASTATGATSRAARRSGRRPTGRARSGRSSATRRPRRSPSASPAGLPATSSLPERVILETRPDLGEVLHGAGHAIGLAIHEPPFLVPRDATELATGMIFTVEPGLYRSGLGRHTARGRRGRARRRTRDSSRRFHSSSSSSPYLTSLSPRAFPPTRRQ